MSKQIPADMPRPDRVLIGGLKEGETPYVTLTYNLDKPNKRLEEFLGMVIGNKVEP